MRSKAILRAACDEIVQQDEGVDYFPSYEIITSQSVAGRFYGPNLRDVTEEGVATVMATLRAAYGLAEAVSAAPAPAGRRAQRTEADSDDLRCEEVLAARFAEGAGT